MISQIVFDTDTGNMIPKGLEEIPNVFRTCGDCTWCTKRYKQKPDRILPEEFHVHVCRYKGITVDKEMLTRPHPCSYHTEANR